ncbi:MAG: S8 family serine peptidase [Candidatus Omnitrophica bacterium]|nr:S8 family serine peptidase [Candidatus Omnitrophota bacterium]
MAPTRRRLPYGLFAIGLLVGPPAWAAQREATAVANQLVVKYQSGYGPAHLPPGLVSVHQQHRFVRAEPVFQGRRALADIQRQYPRRTQRSVSAAQLPDLANVYVLTFDRATDLRALAARYAQDPAVAYAEPNGFVHIQLDPNDTYASSSGAWGQAGRDLWGLEQIHAPAAWDVTRGEGIVVAVVDTGVDESHVDFSDAAGHTNLWLNRGEDVNHNGLADNGDLNGIDDDHNGFVDDLRGWDATTCDHWDAAGHCLIPKAPERDPRDSHGHGTSVAGTIAAMGNNGIGIIGVAWQSRVMPVRALGDAAGSAADAAAAIAYAAANGADVITLGWGDLVGPSRVLEEAVAYAHGLGAVLVASAGNGHRDAGTSAPARLRHVITVAAVDASDQPAAVSNFGITVDLAAPGSADLLSLLAPGSAVARATAETVGPYYRRASGTSMAAAHVAGVCALILASHPTWTNEQIRQALRRSADDVGQPGEDLFTGAGRVNAQQAVGMAVAPLAARIIAPHPAEELTPVVQVFGTAAGPQWLNYTLEYGLGLRPASWHALVTSTTQVYEGLLGLWDTRRLPVDEYGLYTLRLRARTRDGREHVDRVGPLMRPARRITFDAADHVEPAISGNRIVWQDGRRGDWDIAGYDLASGAEFPVVVAPGDQLHPAISGSQVFWEDWRSGLLTPMLHDLATHSETTLPTPFFTAQEEDPTVPGDRIVWQDDRNGNEDIYLYDLATHAERQITLDPADQVNPAISGDWVVWQDHRNGHWDIYGVRLANLPPRLAPIGDRAIERGHRLAFEVTAMDPEGAALTFTVEPLPPGAVFHPTAHIFSWTSPHGLTGNIVVQFQVSDGQWIAEEAVTLTVQDGAPAPLTDVAILAIDPWGVRLRWTVPPDPDLIGYTIYYGEHSRDYPHRFFTTQSLPTVTGLTPGRRYYFAVRPRDRAGQDSPAYSNEVTAVATGGARRSR